MSSQIGTLYLVATPIGNLGDITLRAIEILKSADAIACEDTRETARLLAHYGIEKKPLISYYKDNERRRLPGLLKMLTEGATLALVCDRGTPGISDPAYLLVREARSRGIPVVPAPGPSSLITALSACGLPSDRFSFYGFLPRKKGKKQKMLEGLRERPETLVFFESVYRVAETLECMSGIFGGREAAVGRELTKKFEEIKTGALPELAAWCAEKKPKGEFVIIIKGAENGI